MKHTVTVVSNEKKTVLEVEHGSNLMSILQENMIEIDSPCGGNGKCGKCKVRIVEDEIMPPSADEISIITREETKKGYRLACRTMVSQDMEVYIEHSYKDAQIVTLGRSRAVNLAPDIVKKHAVLNTPNISDQTDDLQRISDVAGAGQINIDLLRQLPQKLRDSNFDVTVTTFKDEIISVEKGNTTNKCYGIALDIGTTTLAGYLYDLTCGKQLDVYSTLNPQRKFGADVLSRIHYCSQLKENQDEMHNTIIRSVNDMIEIFAQRNNIETEHIYEITFAGNTTMIHFLLNISAHNIAVSPFIPATTALLKVRARDLGIDINSGGLAVIFPCVSSYIGADTVAAVLSSNMYIEDRYHLLVDIGTNGEIVLGGKEWLYACSAAAGPAFEGANIRNGTGGIKGAIDKVYYNDGLKFTTIGNSKPIGICGSGIVDVISVLLQKGVVDETGRIIDPSENNEIPEDMTKRIVELDGANAFMLEKGNGSDISSIVITQRDIRELQNAKAAIAAGIITLIDKAAIKIEDIDKVYLAGGFGSHIDIESAATIGLIPQALKEKVISIGNAAGQGVIEGLVCARMLEHADDIKNKIQYIELSGMPEFSNYYIECMIFDS